jgi:hypothetical protein
MILLVFILCAGWLEGVGLWQAAAGLGVCSNDGAVECSAVTCAGFLCTFQGPRDQVPVAHS